MEEACMLKSSSRCDVKVKFAREKLKVCDVDSNQGSFVIY